MREHSELDKYAQEDAHPGDVVMRIIAVGQKSGEIKAGEPFVLGSLFVGSVIRVAVVKMYGNIRENLTNYASYVAESIWMMVKKDDRTEALWHS